MVASGGGGARGAGALSGILGIGVIIVSSVLLAQALGYRTELGYLFGNQLNGGFGIGGGLNSYYGRGGSYNNYNLFGYEFDPLIGISAGGIVVGLLQLISCFFLCCGKRSLSIGWIVFQIIVLIGTIVCFALGIYFEIYSYRNIPGYGYLFGAGGGGGLGGGGLGGGLNPAYIQQLQYQQSQGGLYSSQGLGGVGGGYYGNRYYGDYLCNPTGQAYCGVLGINILGLIVAMILAGVSVRSQGHEAYGSESASPAHTIRLSSERYKV